MEALDIKLPKCNQCKREERDVEQGIKWKSVLFCFVVSFRGNRLNSITKESSNIIRIKIPDAH